MPTLIRPFTLFLWCACLLHMAWGTALWVQPQILHITPLHALFLFCGRSALLTSIGLWSASLLTGALLLKPHISRFDVVLGAFQQVILFTSAVGAIYYSTKGHYADGTVLPPLFILFDQLPSILFALGHFISLILFHRLRPVHCEGGSFANRTGGYYPYMRVDARDLAFLSSLDP